MKHFTNEVKGESNHINLPPMITTSLRDEFTAESQTWLLLTCSEHVLDFRGVLSFDLGMCPALSAFQKVLKANNKKLRSINVSPALQKMFEAEGVAKLVGLDEKPAAAPAPAGAKIDVGFINPFLQATLRIFELQTQTKFVPGKPALQKAGTSLEAGIIGIVALNGSKYQGNIALCFPTAVFLKVYERMLGEALTEITGESEDAVAELLNMIYGQAKTEWNKVNYDFTPAIPTILRGERISVRQQTGGQVIVLPFSSDVGNFHVEIATVPVANVRSAA